MIKIAIYCRLSDEDKDKNNVFDESESIQNQKILLTQYAIEKKWEIFKIYSDDNYSGLDTNRPDFNEMIKDAENKKFDMILCKHQSRFSRDMEVIEKYLHRKFPEWGVRFISITDHVDTLDKGNKKSRQINGLVNEWYCEDISEAIRATFKIKREEGKFIGSFAPYGYKKDPKDHNKLMIDEQVAYVIKSIFNWYLEGYGTQYIAQTLNKKDIPNPTKYKRDKGLKYKNSSQTDDYGLWNKTTIRRILKNEVYIGNMVQGKREKINYKSKKIIQNPESKWIKVENKHEPIIQHEVFYAVQRRFKNKVRRTKKGKIHLFAGKVKCMDCKNSMNKVRASNGYEYLRCKLYARVATKQLCTNHSIRLDVLEEIITDKIKAHMKNVNNKYLVDKFNKEKIFIKNVYALEKKVNAIEKLIKDKDYIIKNLYMDKVKKIINEKQFKELNSKFMKDKEDLIRRKHKIKDKISEIRSEIDGMNSGIEVIEKYMNFKELNYMLVNKLIDHIEVGEKDQDKKEQKVKVYWNF